MNTIYAIGNNIRETRSMMLASLSRKANFTSSLVFPRAPMLPLCERSKSFSLSDLSSSSQRLGDVSPLFWKTVFANTKMIKVICNTNQLRNCKNFYSSSWGWKSQIYAKALGEKNNYYPNPITLPAPPPPFFFIWLFP